MEQGCFNIKHGGFIMIIQHNIMALNAHRQLSANNASLQKNIEKLSSGFKINRAGDDASGLAISEKMRAQIAGLQVAQNNAQDGISLIQTAEGALTEVHSMLNRMVELAEKSANGTIQDDVDREAIQKEVDDLLSEINRISQATNFNGINLLGGASGAAAATPATVNVTWTDGDDGTGASTAVYDLSGIDLSSGGTFAVGGKEYTLDEGEGITELLAAIGGDQVTGFTASVSGNVLTLTGPTTAGQTSPGDAVFTPAGAASGEFELTLQIGDTNESYQQVTVSIQDLSSTGLGINGLRVDSQSAAADSIADIKAAINVVSTNRANLGGLQNRLEHTINNLSVTEENMTAAEARIRDVDMAKEMMAYTKNNVLTQAAQAMLAQANTQPQSVLQLLQ
jgi:flagellin